MKAMVLAAGYGTRLQPLTHHLPKPAIPFCGAPMIQHTLRHLAQVGVTSTVINVHHLADQIENFISSYNTRAKIIISKWTSIAEEMLSLNKKVIFYDENTYEGGITPIILRVLLKHYLEHL